MHTYYHVECPCMARHSNKNNRAIKPTSFITVICDGAPASISSRIPAGMTSYSSGLKKTLSFSSLDASPSSPLLAKRLTPDLGALVKRLRALLERTATVHGTTYGAPIGTRRATPAPHIAIHESLLWRDRGECMIPAQCGGGTVEKALGGAPTAVRILYRFFLQSVFMQVSIILCIQYPYCSYADTFTTK